MKNRLTAHTLSASALVTLAVAMSSCAGSKEEGTDSTMQDSPPAIDVADVTESAPTSSGTPTVKPSAKPTHRAPRLADPFPSDFDGDTLWTMSGLGYMIYEEGTGPEVVEGMTVKVDYAGYLEDGSIFDTSLEKIGARNGFDRGGYPFEPLGFVVGKGKVIRGWDQGLQMMRVGGKRRLIIPPGLGYGSAGAPPAIPGGATLCFDVYVLDARAPQGGDE